MHSSICFPASQIVLISIIYSSPLVFVSLFVVFAFKKMLFSIGLVRNTSTPFCQGKGELLLPSQTFAWHCQLQDLSVGLSYFIGRRLVLWLVKVIKVYLFWMDCQCFSTNLLKYDNSNRLNLGIFFKWSNTPLKVYL